MGWACGAYGWGEGVYRVLVGKPEGRRPLGRPRRRWVDNSRMDLQEVGCGYMDWIGLAQDRDGWRTLVSAVMNVGVPWNAGNFLTSCKPVSFSRRTLHHGVSKWVSKGKVHPRTVHESPDVEQMYSTTFPLTSAIDRMGSQHHTTAALPPGKTRYSSYRGLVGPRAGLDCCGKSRPRRDSIAGPSSQQQVAIPKVLTGLQLSDIKETKRKHLG